MRHILSTRCLSRGHGSPPVDVTSLEHSHLGLRYGKLFRPIHKALQLFQNLFITYEIHLHTVTKVCGDMRFSYFLMSFHVIIEIYPLVPFPPSICKGMSDVTADVLRWRTVTSALTCWSHLCSQKRFLPDGAYARLPLAFRLAFLPLIVGWL